MTQHDAGPLAGLHIVECASFVAGPIAGMTLAQQGAEVIRLDPLGGAADYQRWPIAAGGQSYYWASLNKAKKSVSLDLRHPRGQELAIALITAAGRDRGILIDNLAGASWLAHDRLTARRPDLVHVRLQGHPDGRAAVDYTVNAELGIPTMTGPENHAEPINHVLPAWDLAAGLTLSTGVLTALHQRDRTGQGSLVELALADVGLAAVANLGWLSETQQRGQQRPRHGNHLYGTFGLDFPCRDQRRIMVAALTRRQWSALQQATGTTAVFSALQSTLGTDLAEETNRYHHRELIAAILRPIFASKNFTQLAAELDAAQVLWAPYGELTDIVAAHQRQPHALLADIDLPGTDDGLITARSPLRFDGHYGPAGQAPVLGGDTEQVLTEVVGLTSTDIARLRDEHIIAETP